MSGGQSPTLLKWWLEDVVDSAEEEDVKNKKNPTRYGTIFPHDWRVRTSKEMGCPQQASTYVYCILANPERFGGKKEPAVSTKGLALEIRQPPSIIGCPLLPGSIVCNRVHCHSN